MNSRARLTPDPSCTNLTICMYGHTSLAIILSPASKLFRGFSKALGCSAKIILTKKNVPDDVALLRLRCLDSVLQAVRNRRMFGRSYMVASGLERFMQLVTLLQGFVRDTRLFCFLQMYDRLPRDAGKETVKNY